MNQGGNVMHSMDKLRCNGGRGLFDVPLSTSNLYRPDMSTLLGYLSGYNSSLINKYAISNLLELRLCEYHNSDYCILFASGFWALVSAIKLKSLEGRKNIIIPSMTYRRLADVIHWAGKTPVFVDINVNDLAVSIEAVREAIDSETSLMLAVHPIVNCCDVDEFINLSQETGIPLLFDAVESVHETYKGRRIGSFGQGEIFSFHASKLINGCEGGYVCTNDESFAEELRDFRNFGVVNNGGCDMVGVDSVPLDEHSAFALAGLDEIDINVSHNREIYTCYKRCLSTIKGVRLVEFDEGEQTSFKNIVIEVLDDYPCTRDQLVKFLNDENVLARSHYDPPLHKKEYSYDVIIKDMTNTNFKHKRYINMPCGSIVSVADVEIVVEMIKYLADGNGC